MYDGVCHKGHGTGVEGCRGCGGPSSGLHARVCRGQGIVHMPFSILVAAALLLSSHNLIGCVLVQRFGWLFRSLSCPWPTMIALFTPFVIWLQGRRVTHIALRHSLLVIAGRSPMTAGKRKKTSGGFLNSINPVIFASAVRVRDKTHAINLVDIELPICTATWEAFGCAPSSEATTQQSTLQAHHLIHVPV